MKEQEIGLDSSIKPIDFATHEEKQKDANKLSAERLEQKVEKLNLIKEKFEIIGKFFTEHPQGKRFNLSTNFAGDKINIFQGTSENSWGKISRLGIRIHKASLRRSLERYLPEIFEGLNIIK